MTDFEFNPPTAAAVAAATQSLSQGVISLGQFVSLLRQADGCGNFPSGNAIKTTLEALGTTANQMSNRLAHAIEEYEKTVIAAGKLITQQEAENRQNIAQAGDGKSSAGDSPLSDLLFPKPPAPTTIPSGPNPLDLTGLLDGTTKIPPVPTAAPDAAGTFACPATPEAAGGLNLDICVANLSSADQGVLLRLAQQWQQLGADLTSAITTFHTLVQTQMATGGWTGTSGPAVGAAAHKLVSTTAEISAQAEANGAAIVSWAGSLGDTKNYMDQLSTARTANTAAAPPESRATVQNQIDMMARMKMEGTYNPGVLAIANGLSNLSDPSSPVAGVPLMLNGSSGGSTSGTSGASGGSSIGSSGGSSGGGGGASGGSTSAASKAATDPAGTLARQGSGDAAAKSAAAQNGQANPAAAAQSAASKAGDTAKGLGGRSGASPLTKPSGLGSLADAEKSAASKAAAAGLGKGGGGGAGGGGGGLGKLGGAGIAGAEGSLSARSTAALSAAERAMAAPQAGPAATRAMSPGGTPMGGARGAHAGNDEGKEHKSARYLISGENGEEIAGDLPDTAPPVLGGLNLDTTDNPETPAR